MSAQWEERLQQLWISKINLSFLSKYKYQRLDPETVLWTYELKNLAPFFNSITPIGYIK